MTFPDATAVPGPNVVPSIAMTTVRLPQNNLPANPYFYLIGFNHPSGFGHTTVNLDAPIHTPAALLNLQGWAASASKLRWANIIGVTLLAGPPQTASLTVPISDTPDWPFRYLVSYARSGTVIGDEMFRCAVVNLPEQPTDVTAINQVEHMVRQNEDQRGIALISMTLIAGPAA